MTRPSKKGLKGDIIYTVGLPGCGKSTWAKQYMEELKKEGVKVICIELDEMREEFGVSPDNRETELFGQLLNERQRRINHFLDSGYTVILSDTNLSPKAIRTIEQLGKQRNVASITKKDFTHIPLDICIKRDLDRREKGQRYVGEKVIRRMYQSIRPDDEVVKHANCLVIGDIHGDHQRLEKLLKKMNIVKEEGWKNPDGIFLVFLGDLNDSRMSIPQVNKSRSSYRVMRWVKELYELGWATCVQSNHGLNLINYLRGRRKKLDHGLDYTVGELSRYPKEEREELLEWLESLPYFYSFYGSNNKKVTCVHAQYTPGMSQYHPDGEAMNFSMYGEGTGEKDSNGYSIRVPWWEEMIIPPDELYICGHYHMFKSLPNWEDPNILILDNGCGSDGGSLSSYLIGETGSIIITV